MSQNLLDAVAQDLEKGAGFDMPEDDRPFVSYKDVLGPHFQLLVSCLHTLHTDPLTADPKRFLETLYSKTFDEKVVKDAAEGLQKLIKAIGVPLKEKP
jgi:hypothetical protein